MPCKVLTRCCNNHIFVRAICVTGVINVGADLRSQGGPLPKDRRLHLWVAAQIRDALRAEDPFAFGEKPHRSLVVAPLGEAICLTDGPKAFFSRLAQRS